MVKANPRSEALWVGGRNAGGSPEVACHRDGQWAELPSCLSELVCGWMTEGEPSPSGLFFRLPTSESPRRVESCLGSPELSQRKLTWSVYTSLPQGAPSSSVSPKHSGTAPLRGLQPHNLWVSHPWWLSVSKHCRIKRAPTSYTSLPLGSGVPPATTAFVTLSPTGSLSKARKLPEAPPRSPAPWPLISAKISHFLAGGAC